MVLKLGPQVHLIVISVFLTQVHYPFSLVMRVILSVSSCLSVFFLFLLTNTKGIDFLCCWSLRAFGRHHVKEAFTSILSSQEERIAGSLIGIATAVNAIDGLCICKTHRFVNCNSVLYLGGKMIIYR